MTTAEARPSPESDVPISATSRPRLPLLNRVTYGLGDFASGFAWTTAGSYLTLFYTDTVGIAAGVAGALMLGARIFDALIDPLIGALAERTRSKYGRFRPWILYGMLPLAVFSVLTFTAPFPGDSGAAVAYAVFTYGLLGILFSAVNLPYGALATAMAETPADRVSMNSFRYIGINLNAVLLALVTVPLVVYFSGVGDGQTTNTTGYTITVALFALVSLPMFFAVFKTSRETITPVRREPVPLRATARALLTNIPFLVFIVATLLTLVALFGRLGVVIYYYLYNVGNVALVPLLMSLPPLAGVLGTLALAPLARFVGKRNMYIIGLAGQSVSLILLYVVGFDNLTAIIILSVTYGISSFGLAMAFSMIGDVVDYGEYRSGIRADGTGYAVFSFSTKVASAIAGAGVALFALFGYQPNVQQTATALGGINLVVNLLPALIGIAALLVLIGYRITDKDAADIRNKLNAASARSGDG